MSLRRWVYPSLSALLIVAACTSGEDPEPALSPDETPTATAALDPSGSPVATPAPTDGITRKPFQETFLSAPTSFVSGGATAFRVLVTGVHGPASIVPMANANVAITLFREGKWVASVLDAQTDATGSLSRAVKFPNVADGNYEMEVKTTSPLGEEKSTTPVTVGQKTKVLLVTDKPLYQPNQTIHLRALALHDFDQTPAAGAEVELVVEDAKGNRVFKQKKKAGEFGEVSTDFKLADEVNEGEWRVKATIAGVESDKAVTVKRYVLPKFKVALDGGKGFFMPGETVKGKIQADYFFGKPVADGEVTITASTFDVAFHEFTKVSGRTDADGSFKFELELPKSFVGQPLQNGDALFRMEVAVKDKAEHTERSSKNWPVAADSFRVTLVPESGKLVPGVENRVWAIATTPDGAALAGTKITLDLDGKKSDGITDDAGIAAISFVPEKEDFTTVPAEGIGGGLRGGGRGGWNNMSVANQGGERQLPVKLSAKAPSGDKIERDELLAAENRGVSVLLRPDRSIYKGGSTASIDVLTARHSGVIYLDVIKQGQTLATRVVEVKDGKGHIELPLSSDFSGTLEMHAYVIPHDGNIVRDTKVVYVSPASDLLVSARPDKSVYRPGDKAVIRFQVTDKNGSGVAAAIAAVIVDESVYALQEIQPGLEKVYFTLEKELSEPKYEIHYSEESLTSMIKNPPREARKQRAASILLAKAENVYTPALTVNPTATRVQAERQKLQQAWYYLTQQVANRGYQTPEKPIGKKGADGKWTWAFDPFEGFATSGWIAAGQKAEDAWGRPISVAVLEEAGYPASYDEIAALQTAQRLQNLYYHLYTYAANHPKEVMNKPSGNIWEAEYWTFPSDVFARMEKKGWLVAAMRKDLWGKDFRYVQQVVDLPARQNVWYTQLKRSRVMSAGPDGMFSTFDDIDEPYIGDSEFWNEQMQLDEVAFGDDFGGIGNMAVLGAIGAGEGRGGLGMRGMGAGGGAKGAMAMPAPQLLQKNDRNKDADKRAEGLGTRDMATVATGAPRTEAKVSRVREYFPETLLWEPSLITDRTGKAQLELEMADSITNWRMTCSANSKGGALGSCEGQLKVFQDFFVDLDLPVALTRGDEVTIPVAVYNYLETKQDVRLVIAEDSWFELLSPAEQRVSIGPGDVDVRYYRIRAKQVGTKKLEVAAYGPKLSDAIRKEIEVVPDGKMVEVAKSDRLSGEVSWSFELPEDSIADASRSFVKLYPGMFSQVVEGVDGILRLPGGCMEQTGSSAYPNVLVMDYLQRSKQMRPATRMKAEEYVSLGYQRLLTFQAANGGFALWGSNDKPIVFLTAWGLQILQDAAKVSDVDPKVLDRAKTYLAARQEADGSFPVEFAVHREIWGRMEGSFGITAYVAWSLAEGGDKSPMAKRAFQYLEKNVAQVKDPYLVALASAAFASWDRDAAITKTTLDRLDEMKTVDAKAKTVAWGNGGPTGVYTTGKEAQVETTALAAYALHKGGRHTTTVNQALTYVVQGKDASGNWGGTQATILALKALLAASDPSAGGDSADVDVILNGNLVSSVQIRPENSDVVQIVDLRAGLKPGKNTVTIASKSGENGASTMYQATGRWYLPWRETAPKADDPLALTVTYDRTNLSTEDIVTAKVDLLSRDSKSVFQTIVDLGIPPGFEVDRSGLDALRDKKVIDKYTLTGRQITIYIQDLQPKKTLSFSYALKARLPIKAKSPKSTAYQYYTPSKRAEAAPVNFVVTQR